MVIGFQRSVSRTVSLQGRPKEGRKEREGETDLKTNSRSDQSATSLLLVLRGENCRDERLADMTRSEIIVAGGGVFASG